MTEQERKGSLPYGWQVKVSKRYPDRIYYFNVFTGSSTWECPKLDPPKEITKEDNIFSSVSKKVTEKEDKSFQLCKDVSEKLSQVKDEKVKECSSYSLNSAKIADTLPEIKNRSEKKCNVFIPNSVRKILKENLRELKNSNEESGKSNVPPTAIVAPVMLGKKSCDLQNKTVDDRLKQGKPRKRSLDEANSNFCDNPAKVVKEFKSPPQKTTASPLIRADSEKSSKKIRISPLNRTDSAQKGSISGQTVQKDNKRLKTSLNSGSDDSPERAEKIPLESSPSDESNKVEDIEMLDVSIDVMEDLTEKKETVVDKFASYYIVVDTNVLISELDLINEIKDTPLDGCGPPHIFIPWIVIEELDRLKNQRSLKSSIMRAVCEAIRYFNSVLGKHPRFHGQSPAEAEKWAKTYSKCNDDRILECCMGLADKMPREKVILLTNDKNLVNKALICNIIVHDSTSLMKHVKPDVVFTYSKVREKRPRKSHESSSEVVSSNTTTKIAQISKESPAPDKNLMLERDECKREIHSVMSKARELLKHALTKFFTEEMEEAYGDIWHSFPIKRNLLEGILEGIIRYWPVFSAFMISKDKRNFELLKEKIRRPAGVWGDKEDCLVILSTMEEIFTQIQKRRPSVNVPVSVIQDFRVACVKFFNKYNDVESVLQTAGQQAVLSLFEQNWAAINQISGIILDYCNIPHDFVYIKPDVLPSEKEIRQLIVNLYPGVEQLKTLMFSMLNAVRNCKPVKKIIRKLAEALLKFIPSLEIPYEHVPVPEFSAEALEVFCTRLQNREMIEIGYKQIENFFSKLDDALTSIMSSKFKKRSTSPETMICD